MAYQSYQSPTARFHQRKSKAFYHYLPKPPQRKVLMRKKNETDAGLSERFIEMARALGADEDEAAFKAKLAVIARQKPMSADKTSKPETD